jgi:Abortive infection C-terminus
VFAARRLLEGASTAMNSVKAVSQAFDAGYMSQQVIRLESSLGQDDPELAIGTAKEFVETVCRTILGKKGVVADHRWDFPKLVSETMDRLQLLPRAVDGATEGAKTLRMVLQNLVKISHGLTELRNPYQPVEVFPPMR